MRTFWKILPLLTIFWCCSGICQSTIEIELLDADIAKFNKTKYQNIQILIGNVALKHESAYLYCDSAYLNKDRNDLEAFGHIEMIENDTIHLFGKYLIYNGNTKIAEVHDSVKLVDPTTVMNTDILFFDRNIQMAYYQTGATIENGDKILVSDRGYYYLKNKNLNFFHNVNINNPDYLLVSDTVYYNCITEKADVVNKTTLYNKTNTLYCENGHYDTKNKQSFLSTNVNICYNEYLLYSDSLFYDDSLKYAEAYRNVIVIDTTHNAKSWSEYLEYNKNKEYAFISDSATARLIKDTDTVFVFADTLRAEFDNTKEEVKFLYAYKKTRIFNADYQAVCDSAIYIAQDSTAKMYYAPALWANSNQITGDSMSFFIKNKSLEKITASANGFIVEEDSLGAFNQFKGNVIDIFFNEENINYINIGGNAQTIYFLREEDGTLIGPYNIASSDAKILFENKDISELLYLKEPTSELLPEEKTTKDKEQLEGFLWREKERPSRPLKAAFFN